MKQKNLSDQARTIRRILRNIIAVRIICVISALLLLRFAVWYFDERPQFIEVNLTSMTDIDWNYIEYATRHNYEGHYWIVRYLDICYKKCDEWLQSFDYFESELRGEWIPTDIGGPFARYCAKYFPELWDTNLIKRVSYEHRYSGFPPTLTCVATRYAGNNSGDIELWLMTIHASPLTSLYISM